MYKTLATWHLAAALYTCVLSWHVSAWLSREAVITSQSFTGSKNEITQQLLFFVTVQTRCRRVGRPMWPCMTSTLRLWNSWSSTPTQQRLWWGKVMCRYGIENVNSSDRRVKLGIFITLQVDGMDLLVCFCPNLPDVAPSSQPAAAQRSAGCLLQVPAQPTGPLQLSGHPGVRRHALLQRPAQVGA